MGPCVADTCGNRSGSASGNEMLLVDKESRAIGGIEADSVAGADCAPTSAPHRAIDAMR
jgi:hypothetical protein